MFLRHLVHWPSVDIHENFYGDRPSAAEPLRSDFGAFECHILETVQDSR